MKTSAEIICLLVIILVYDVTAITLNQMLVDSRKQVHYDPDPRNMLGVNNWSKTFSKHCGGNFQSPVNIETDKVRYGVFYQCPRLIPRTVGMRTKGFSPDRPLSYSLTNVPHRPGIHYLHDIHLHYGGLTRDSNFKQGQRFRGRGIMGKGSEHTFNGQRYDGELHLVFYNSKYRNAEEASDKKDGVAVIAFLIQITANGRRASRFSKFLQRNISPTYPYQTNLSTEVAASMFFNGDCEFFTYAGSKTTPQCQETVQWIIIRRPIRVTSRTWLELSRFLSAGYVNARFGTTRPTQPLNGRVIEANFMRSYKVVLPMPMTSKSMPRRGGARRALVKQLNRKSQIHSFAPGVRRYGHAHVSSFKMRQQFMYH